MSLTCISAKVSLGVLLRDTVSLKLFDTLTIGGFFPLSSSLFHGSEHKTSIFQ